MPQCKNERYLISADDGFIDIKGYEGRYQIHNDGTVRRLYAKGYARNIEPRITRSDRHGISIQFRLTDANGKKKNYYHTRLFCMAYGIEVPKGYVCMHKNGIMTDNRFENMAIAKRGYVSSHKQNGEVPVYKIHNATGKIVKQYKSIAEAAKCNGLPREMISKYCNKPQVKSRISPDYSYVKVRDCYKKVDRSIKDK